MNSTALLKMVYCQEVYKIIKNMKSFLLLSVIMWSPFTVALTYEWPYTERVDVEVPKPGTMNFTLHMGTAVIDDPKIHENSLASEVIFKKTGTGSMKDVYFYDFHRHILNSGKHDVAVKALASVPYNATFKAFAKKITTLYGHGVIHNDHGVIPMSRECVGTIAGVSHITENFEDWQSINWNGGVTSAIDSCIGIPPTNEWCALITPELSLNYERINVDNAVGARVTGSVAVECTTGMKYTLRLQSPQGIKLSNGMTANIEANDLPLNSVLWGEAGTNSANISSVLSGTPEKTGPFNGEGILFVSYP
jgi:hypothetical protein